MIIDDYICGKVNAREFAKWFMACAHAAEEIDLLLPKDAINNPSHKIYCGYDEGYGFHRAYNYDVMKDYGFSVSKMLASIDAFGGRIGDDYNLYEYLYLFYTVQNPMAPYYSRYAERFELSLDAVADYYEGPEVEEVIKRVIDKALQLEGKAKQKAYVKQELKEAFHITNNVRPYWIQGGDWPMGTNSPMKYVSKKKKGEEHLYLFRDVDTGKERVVSQWW